MDHPPLIIDASDGNWPQLVRQLTAMSQDENLHADLICPTALRYSATQLISRLNLVDRIMFVTEDELVERVAALSHSGPIPLAI